MTDRELLERAGEAFGFDHISVHANGKVYGHDGICNPVAWNPLTDDGDALRLAVKLKLEIGLSIDGCVYAFRRFTEGHHEPLGGTEASAYAATRRAIVRAAAALGEQGK